MEITQELVRELLDYDPETGVFTWKERDRRLFKTGQAHTRWNNMYSGKRAGWECEAYENYRRRALQIWGKTLLEHRLAFLYTEGNMPKLVDHINGDATDNRWCNLRDASRTDNSFNRSMSKNNKSGHTGVSWHKRSKRWCANVRIDGVLKSLGSFDDIEKAAAVALKAREDAGFSTRHGKKMRSEEFKVEAV